MPLDICCQNPDCRKRLRVGDHLQGKRIRCPACGNWTIASTEENKSQKTAASANSALSGDTRIEERSDAAADVSPNDCRAAGVRFLFDTKFGRAILGTSVLVSVIILVLLVVAVERRSNAAKNAAEVGKRAARMDRARSEISDWLARNATSLGFPAKGTFWRFDEPHFNDWRDDLPNYVALKSPHLDLDPSEQRQQASLIESDPFFLFMSRRKQILPLINALTMDTRVQQPANGNASFGSAGGGQGSISRGPSSTTEETLGVKPAVPLDSCFVGKVLPVVRNMDEIKDEAGGSVTAPINRSALDDELTNCLAYQLGPWLATRDDDVRTLVLVECERRQIGTYPSIGGKAYAYKWHCVVVDRSSKLQAHYKLLETNDPNTIKISGGYSEPTGREQGRRVLLEHIRFLVKQQINRPIASSSLSP